MTNSWGKSWGTSWSTSWGVSYSNSLKGTLYLDLVGNGRLTGRGHLKGQTDLAFSLSGPMTGYAFMTGTVPLSFANEGSLRGVGHLKGQTDLVFTVSSQFLSSVEFISGTAVIVFDVRALSLGYDLPYGLNDLTEYLELYPENTEYIPVIYSLTYGDGPDEIYEES